MFVESEEQNWLKWTHVSKFFGLEDIRTSLNGLEKWELLTRQAFVPSRRVTLGCSGPKDQENKTDKFLSVYGVMYVIVNSQKDKGKALKEHILKNIISRGLDVRIKEIQGEHNQQTIQLQKTIQEDTSYPVWERRLTRLDKGKESADSCPAKTWYRPSLRWRQEQWYKHHRKEKWRSRVSV